jgi:hypothetical protein
MQPHRAHEHRCGAGGKIRRRRERAPRIGRIAPLDAERRKHDFVTSHVLPETAGAQHVIGDNVRSGIDAIGSPRKRSDSVPLIASEPHEVFSHTAGSARHEDFHRKV